MGKGRVRGCDKHEQTDGDLHGVVEGREAWSMGDDYSIETWLQALEKNVRGGN